MPAHNGSSVASRLTLIITLFGLLVVTGCANYQERPDTSRLDSPQKPDLGRVDISGRDVGVVGGVDELSLFAAHLAAKLRPTASVGTLPLVSLSYGVEHQGPWVSLLGERMADDVARQLAGNFPGGTVIPVAGMAVRVSEGNTSLATLSGLEAVARHGARLGVDAIVFGTIRRDDNVGDWNRSALTVELYGWDVEAGRIAAKGVFVIESGRDTRTAFELAQRESHWQPDGKWAPPRPQPTLEAEIRVASQQLANRLVPAMTPENFQGTVYLPPADTSTFVKSVARLRAAQVAFAAEYNRRLQDAAANGGKVEVAGGMTLNGVEFRTLQEAEDYLAVLTESLNATSAARLGQNISSMMSEVFTRKLAPHPVRVNDFGATRPSDSQLVLGELATGGLTDKRGARQALQNAGIGMVVAPRLEQFGDAFVLRATVHDLAAGSIVTSSHVTLASTFQRDLQRELDVEDYGPTLRPIRDGDSDGQTWNQMFEKAKHGVVRLTGKRGLEEVQGTGFVASRDGLIITNSHVASALGDDPSAFFEDGTRVKVKTVMDNPFWDVAVVRAERMPRGARVLRFADADAARVGIEVAVLGHPKNTDGWVLSRGHLSSVSEEVQTTRGRKRPSYLYTCPTRAGTSGSPVLNSRGEVLAVNSHGLLGEVMGTGARAELTGFAFGAPGPEAEKLLQNAPTTP